VEPDAGTAQTIWSVFQASMLWSLSRGGSRQENASKQHHNPFRFDRQSAAGSKRAGATPPPDAGNAIGSGRPIKQP
jgi:hypothetical protein